MGFKETAVRLNFEILVALRGGPQRISSNDLVEFLSLKRIPKSILLELKLEFQSCLSGILWVPQRKFCSVS